MQCSRPQYIERSRNSDIVASWDDIVNGVPHNAFWDVMNYRGEYPSRQPHTCEFISRGGVEELRCAVCNTYESNQGSPGSCRGKCSFERPPPRVPPFINDKVEQAVVRCVRCDTRACDQIFREQPPGTIVEKGLGCYFRDGEYCAYSSINCQWFGISDVGVFCGALTAELQFFARFIAASQDAFEVIFRCFHSLVVHTRIISGSFVCLQSGVHQCCGCLLLKFCCEICMCF